MEASPTKVVLVSYNETIAKGHISKNLSFNFPRQSSNQKGVRLGCKRFMAAFRSKKSSFQDFQGFVQPLRLLPVTEAKIFSQASIIELGTSIDAENSDLYVLKLYTSNQFGSELRDVNAAVLLCLIDASKTSVLQRVSTVFTEAHEHMNVVDSNQIHFRTGSEETIIFRGPKLGKIEAIWLGLESGSWRLGGVRLIVLGTEESSLVAEEHGNIFYTGTQYDFQLDDLLLGEGGDTSITELRPKVVTDIPRLSLPDIIDIVSRPLALISEQVISTEEGLKQYSDLKLSLLIYDVILVSFGTVALNVTSTEEISYAFLFGGLFGFVYLLLLQKSVDALSTSALPSADATGNLTEIFNGFRGPLTKTVFLLATVAGVAKYGLGILSVELTPQELLVGFVGFLTCKVAVLLSAFKPLGSSWREN